MLRFNRTFMELKYSGKYGLIGIIYVLIVPLWNWNTTNWLNWRQRTRSFNRTFMELKLECRKSLHSLIVRFNRTFMELKCKDFYKNPDKFSF